MEVLQMPASDIGEDPEIQLNDPGDLEAEELASFPTTAIEETLISGTRKYPLGTSTVVFSVMRLASSFYFVFNFVSFQFILLIVFEFVNNMPCAMSCSLKRMFLEVKTLANKIVNNLVHRYLTNEHISGNFETQRRPEPACIKKFA